VPVDRLLRRENHPLGVRRNEVTRLAAEQAEEAAAAASAGKRWSFGVAAGALLVAGTFAAGALGITGGTTPVAGSAPEHAPATPGHNPGGSGQVIGAPASGKADNEQKPADARAEQTSSVTAAGQQAGVPVPRGGGMSQGGSDRSGGGTTGSGSASVVTPAPAPEQQQPAPQQPAPTAPGQQQGSGGSGGSSSGGSGGRGSIGGVLDPVTDVVGGVLDPVTDVVGGILSPLSRSAPSSSGPALTMINPLGDLLGG
jgi:hypothetical protein